VAPLLNIITGHAELRLAVVSPFLDRRHGTERALAELLERLARDYHCEIHLYAERAEDLTVAAPRSAHPTPTGFVVWHKVPSFPGPHLAKFLAWMIANSCLRWWHRITRGLLFDLVLSPGVNCWDADIIIVHVVFQRLRELSLEKTAGETPRSGSLRVLHRRAYYGLLTALERRLYSDPRTALAAVSQRTATLLTEYFGRRDVRVIPNGVDAQVFCESNRSARREQARQRLGFCESDFILLLIGNDWRVKGVPTILNAMVQLPTLPIHLLVVGNDAPESFHAQATRLGVLDRCHWESPRPEVLDFYAAADVYVSPSREDSFGLPVAEAMACGLPVITSSQAGVSALLRDGIDGFVLGDPQDTQSLTTSIRRLYSDASFRRNIGEAAAKTAKGWTWDRSAAEIWALLQASATNRAKNPAK
jgi:UDP-glucose:(heptosyl)LPS alpha-1,3-glucosyltransferase